MANVPEYCRISTVRSGFRGALQPLNLFGKHFLNLKNRKLNYTVLNFMLFNHRTFYLMECPMANVPEHGQISARFQQGPLQTLNLLGKRFLNMKIVSFVPFRYQTFYSIECQLASSLRRLSPKLAKRQQLPRDRCKYVLEMKLVLHVMGHTPGTFPLKGASCLTGSEKGMRDERPQQQHQQRASRQEGRQGAEARQRVPDRQSRQQQQGQAAQQRAVRGSTAQAAVTAAAVTAGERLQRPGQAAGRGRSEEAERKQTTPGAKC